MSTRLSRYYPKATVYFHFRPVGEDSKFYNGNEAWLSAFGAGRALVYADDSTKIVAFSEISTSKILSILSDELGSITIDRKNIVFIDGESGGNTKGYENNAFIKSKLKELLPKGKFVMSQPYLDDELSPYYQIPPELTIWLNDKENMKDFIPEEFLLRHILTFPHGIDFANYEGTIPVPCVAKVASSSGGYGVHICLTEEDLKIAKEKFKKVEGLIFIEEYREVMENYCMQFGIPHDKNAAIEMIGVSEQLTTPQGGFLGGIIDQTIKSPSVAKIEKIMLEKVLPAVSQKGWYGVGGIDVIVDKEGKFYFIDCNFRMTATLPFIHHMNSKKIEKNMVTFTSTFNGNEEELRKKIFPLAKQGQHKQLLDILAFTKHEDHYVILNGLLYENVSSLEESARQLKELGLEAKVLEILGNK